MRNGKIRRFRPRSNKHYSHRRSNGPIKNKGIQQLNGQRNSFSRNNTTKNPHSLEKIIEKYNNLAKEALSFGDKTLHENYLQHSDHFSRILSEVSENQKQNNVNSEPKTISPIEEKK